MYNGRMERAFRPGALLGKFFRFLFLFAMTMLVLIPFLWMILTSLMPDARALLLRPIKLPWPPSFQNYVIAWQAHPFGIYFVNSVFVSVTATVFSVLTAMLAGYAFTFLRFPCKNLLFLLVLAVLMMPTQVAIIPLYATISKMGWLNTYKSLIIPFIVDAYGIYLIRQHFTSVPLDFVEAAKMEGAGHLRILFQIMMSLTKPSLVAYAIMAFKWRWNDYFWVLMMTSSTEKRTLPVGLVMMKYEEGVTQWQLIMAATLIVLLPIIIVYLFSQKVFRSDYMAGGTKG